MVDGKTTYHFSVSVHEYGVDWGVHQKNPTFDLGLGRVRFELDEDDKSSEADRDRSEAVAGGICASIIRRTERMVAEPDNVSDCVWQPISADTSWCEVHGTLRHGTWKEMVYQDPETGNPIKLTSTGYYPPQGGWEDGPVPLEYQVDVYDKPYTYVKPESINEKLA